MTNWTARTSTSTTYTQRPRPGEFSPYTWASTPETWGGATGTWGNYGIGIPVTNWTQI